MIHVFEMILFIHSLRDETAKRNLAYLQTVLGFSSMDLKRLDYYVNVMHSTQNITQKIEFLMKEVGFSKEEIIKNAWMLKYSRKRIEARYEFARISGVTTLNPYSVVKRDDARFAKLCGKTTEEYKAFYDSR